MSFVESYVFSPPYSIPCTEIFFWVVHGEGSERVQISPTDYPLDKDTVKTQLEASSLDIQVYTNEVTNLAFAFGLFAQGSIFQEDFDKFADVLESWWRENSVYLKATVRVLGVEYYYQRSTGLGAYCISFSVIHN